MMWSFTIFAYFLSNHLIDVHKFHPFLCTGYPLSTASAQDPREGLIDHTQAKAIGVGMFGSPASWPLRNLQWILTINGMVCL